MALKDPAFLFYPGDWLLGTVLFNRRQKGCYIDLLLAQFSVGHLSIDNIKNILGDDYVAWESVLKDKFTQDDNGKYYNKRLDFEIKRRGKNSERQRENVTKRWNAIGKDKKDTDTDTTPGGDGIKSVRGSVIPLEIEIETEIEIENNKEKEKIVELYNIVVDFFDDRFKPKNDSERFKWYEVLDKLVRIDNHTPKRIIEVIKWAREDKFWKTNFMSLAKLRKTNKEDIMYFDVFDVKLRASDHPGTRGPKMSDKYLIKSQKNENK